MQLGTRALPVPPLEYFALLASFAIAPCAWEGGRGHRWRKRDAKGFHVESLDVSRSYMSQNRIAGGNIYNNSWQLANCVRHSSNSPMTGVPTALLQDGRRWREAPTLYPQMMQSCVAEHVEQSFMGTQRQRGLACAHITVGTPSFKA